jgi:DNA-directed RNA polymerase beta subunit
LVVSQDDALEFLGSYSDHVIPKDKRKAYAKRVLDTELLPHLGINATNEEKATFLGRIINKLLKVVIGVRAEDDRDNVSNKRYESTGILFTELCRSLYKRWIEYIKEQVSSKHQDIISAISRTNHITSNFNKCMATGNWGVVGNSYIRTGVSQILARLSYIAYISHLNRMIVPSSKEGKNTKIRQINPSQIFFECTVDTPEGAPAGIVTHLSFMTNITNRIPTVLVKSILEYNENLITLKSDKEYSIAKKLQNTHVFLNGIPLGFCEDPYVFVEELRDWRTNGRLSPYVSITYDRYDNEIQIFSDEGRMVRPLFKVQDGKLLVKDSPSIDWDFLVEEGYIQYLDTLEAEYSEIVMKESEICPSTEYCEIHPSMLMGICANLIPFPDHTQGPRNTYQCLTGDTPILLADGSWKKIETVIEGDKIITFHPKIFEKSVTKIIYTQSSFPSKRLLKIETINGKKLKATEDHKIMTNHGWKEIRDLNIKKDKLIIFPEQTSPSKITFNSSVISQPRENKREMINSESNLENDGKYIFVTIKKIIEKKRDIVYDITTESENHSFIAGDGFGVHNCNMSKQALGMYNLSHQLRSDTMAYVMDYPQKPLTSTRIADITGYNDMPSGINAIVAVICNPYSQEDSIVLNKSALERGIFVTTSYRTIVVEEKKRNSHARESIELPSEKIRLNYNYSLLNENGIISPGIPVYQGDIIVGKVIIKSERNSPVEYIDASVTVKACEEGMVDRVFETVNPDGYKLVKVIIRKTRIPEVGDKFACTRKNAEVLTTTGWKRIKNITKEDKVAILDNDNVKYENPLEIHQYDYDGKMYELRSKQVDLTVTPNHRLWVKKEEKNNYEFMNAEKAFGQQITHKKNINLFEPTDPIGNFFTIPEYTVPAKKVSMNDWLIFFGIWLVNGYVTENIVHIIPHNDVIEKLLEPVIKNMGYNISKFEHDWRIYNIQLSNYMKQFNFEEKLNKFMPNWVWRLDKKQCRLLLGAIELKKGYISSSNFKYYTSSTQLADDITRLALHAGFSANFIVLEEKNQKENINNDNYLITIFKTEVECQINQDQNEQSEKWVDYKGKVYCLTVRTGVFFVRENGKSVWSGNSRSAQKATTGMIIPQEDMPFTSSGMCPDLILNPHALPSRMTISQLLECALSKVCALKGKRGDCTAFEHDGDILTEKIGEKLKQFGYDAYGWEQMYSGITGEPIRAKIFIGPTYYQRLKHLVSEKMHCLTMDHEVLTISGWKTIYDLSYDDEVATLKEGELVYEKPTHIFIYHNFEGNIYTIQNSEIDLSVTYNHRMWVTDPHIFDSWEFYTFIEAHKLIGQSVRYKKNANWKIKDFQFILPPVNTQLPKKMNRIPSRVLDMDYWLIFLGFWYARGTLVKKNIYIKIINSADPYIFENNLYPALVILGCKYKVKTDKVIVYNYQIYRYLRFFNNLESEKELPEWITILSSQQCKKLVESMILAGGDTDVNTGKSFYYTLSRNLANQFQILCLHAGYSADISIYLHKTFFTDGNDDLLKVTVYKANPSINVIDSHQMESFGFDQCSVFCLSVSSEVFYVRRNGKTSWTGNSRAYGPVTTLTRQPTEGRVREGGLRFGLTIILIVTRFSVVIIIM